MSNVVKQTLCLVICVALTTAGCATGGTRIAPVPAGQQSAASRSALVEYMQKLPAGTVVRVNRAQGHSVYGALMKASAQSIFIQPKTRLPEAIVEIPVDDVLTVTPESKHGNNVGRAIGAGAAAGAAAAITILLILIAAAYD